MRKAAVQAVLVLAFVSASGRAEDLKEFASEAGRFKVLLPGKPEPRELKIPRGTMHLVSIRTDQGEYLASWIDLPLEESAEKAEARLDRMRDGIVERVMGKVVREKTVTLDDKHPGRDLVAEVSQPDKGRLRARLFLVGSRLYQVIAVGTKGWTESKEADQVLDSFALVK